jgi:hypothetical protein
VPQSGAKEYLALKPGMADQLAKYFAQFGWQLHVEPLVCQHAWETTLVEDVFRLVSPHAITFVASCIGLALLPTHALFSPPPVKSAF